MLCNNYSINKWTTVKSYFNILLSWEASTFWFFLPSPTFEFRITRKYMTNWVMLANVKKPESIAITISFPRDLSNGVSFDNGSFEWTVPSAVEWTVGYAVEKRVSFVTIWEWPFPGVSPKMRLTKTWTIIVATPQQKERTPETSGASDTGNQS